MKSQTLPENPDFAFPQTVMHDAEAVLESAPKRNLAKPAEANIMLQAWLQYFAAATDVNPESGPATIVRIEQALASTPAGDYRAMLTTLLARIYTAYYDSNRWGFDRRQLPLEPRPADITEWSEPMFTARIDTLCRAAVADASALPLQPYIGAVMAKELELECYPTVRDFVLCQAVNIFTEVKLDPADFIATGISASAPGTASRMAWELQRVAQMKGDKDARMAELCRLATPVTENQWTAMPLLRLSELASLNNDIEINNEKQNSAAAAVGMIDQYLAAFAANQFTKHIAHARTELCAPGMRLYYPNLLAQPRAEVEYEEVNTPAFKIVAYRVPGNMTDGHSIKRKDLGAPVAHATVRLDTVPPFKAEGAVTLTLPGYGTYIIEAQADGIKNEESIVIWNSLTRVVPVLPIVVNNVRNPQVVVADAVSGTPVPEATVTISASKDYLRSHPKAKAQTRSTNGNGIAIFDDLGDVRYPNVTVSHGGGDYAFPSLCLRSDEAADETETTPWARVLTDRAIYHPGDVLRVAAVCANVTTSSSGTRSALAKGIPVKINLQDANYQEVGTITATTDDFGRATAEFTLPKDGLTGEFTIEVEMPDYDDEDYDDPIFLDAGRATVIVSDYRMPQIQVTDLSVERDAPEAGSVTVSGRAMTYSGMPVGGAEITATLYAFNPMRWLYSRTKRGELSLTTDAEGRFTAVFPSEMLSDKYYGTGDIRGFFDAAFRAVSPAGDTAEGSARFSTGKPYVISITAPEIADGEQPFTFRAEAVDANGKSQDIPLRWMLVSKADSASAACGDTFQDIDLKAVRPGKYSLTVQPADLTLAAKADTEILIYNQASGIVPTDDDIWTPVTTVDATAGEGQLLITAAQPETMVYVAVSARNKVSSLTLHTVNQGYTMLPYKLPDDCAGARIRLFTARDGKVTELSIATRDPERARLTITGEAMRDRLTPGTPETWRFRVTDADSKPVMAALVLDLYNQALDALTQHRMRVGFPFYAPQDNMYVTYPTQSSNHFYANSHISPSAYYLGTPWFNFFGNARLIAFQGITLNGSIYGYRRPGIGSIFERTDANSNRRAMFKTGPAVAYSVSRAEVAEDAVAEMEMAMTTGANEEGGAQSPAQVDFREADVPLAAWAPMLTTAPDGAVEYTFTVPNAVTTWQLLAAAWDADCQAGAMMRSFIANKPVMVQPNWPRFLRHGDSTLVAATIFNNSDTAGTAMVEFTLFEPMTSKTLSAGSRMVRLAPGEQRTVDFPLNTAQLGMPQMSAIGARISARLAGFADGEQTAIPLLTSDAQLIETTPFYLNPGQSDYQTQLPKGKDERLTLTYCENPAWSVVSALPGLRKQTDYANSAAAALFSAAVARGILDDNPAIASALRAWNDSPADSALVSALERNADLKIALLSATPWVQAAMSQTERMGRLALIFDEKETSAAIDKAAATLSKLQRADGGWAWSDWCPESSRWVTLNVLTMLADLHTRGWLPQDAKLTEVLSPALAYLDSKDMADNMLYAYVRPLLASYRPTPQVGMRSIDKTISSIRKDWRGYTADVKALAAMVMWNNDRKDEARELAASIEQYGVASPSQGMSFPSVSSLASYGMILEALATISPASPAVDGVRQYLIVRKQATDWGSAVVTTQVVNGLLSCGTRWTVPASPASITAAGTEITPDSPAETATGSIRANLTPYAGETLTIRRADPVGPAYGAVYAQLSKTMRSVKAAACPDLSVEKSLAVMRDGQWTRIDTLRLGDRVKVQLTIKTGRDLQYVSVIDERPAAFEPAQQLPGYVYSDGAAFYRENRDAVTTLAIGYLRPGTYILEYEMNVARVGSFASGVASAQSQYAPEIAAHSAGSMITVAPDDEE